MYRKNIIYILGLCIINIFILLSKFPIEIKVISFLMGSLVGILNLVRQKKTALWTGIYVVTMLVVNFICSIEVQFDYIKTYSSSYNVITKWMTTQIDYTWNTGNGEVILPTIFRDKSIYVLNDEKYTEFIRYFSKEVCFLENEDYSKIKFEKMKEESINLGRMTAHMLPWLWEDEMCEELRELRLNSDTTPKIFVSSMHVASEENLVAVSDKGYNLYIWTYEEYQEE